MASIDKLVERFKQQPADFTWAELARLLAHFGYVEQKGKGSRRKFKGEGLPTLSLHAPHPANVVKLYVLREIRDVLELEGLL
ncbi:MAG: type II toxin-antitoxin system HicA family toxin [Hyphomonadaceae bacterium]|nr:type II toxin-antitoxin system HicA family toxin [Hyphomonadaceae bacterium]